MKRGSDGMLPGFYFPLHFWIAYAGGADELVTRAPGLLFFALGVAVFLHTLARITSSSAAGWAAFIILFSKSLTLIDLRAYNWLLGGLAMTFALVLSWDRSPRRARLCALNALLQLFIWSQHPYACLYASAIGAGVILAPGRWKEKSLYLASFLPAAALLGAWTPYMAKLTKLTEPWNWIPRPGWPELGRLYFSLPLTIGGLLAGGALIVALSPHRRPSESDQPLRTPPALWISSAAILVIPFALWLYSQGPAVVVIPRYTIPVLLAWAALAAALYGHLEANRQPMLGRGALWLATAVVSILALTSAFSPAQAKYLRAMHEYEGGLQETAYVPADSPILMESMDSFLPRHYYNLGRRSYWFVFNHAMARSGKDALGAAVAANTMQRMKESGLANVLTIEDALALAQKKRHVYLIDDRFSHSLDPLMLVLTQQGWKSRVLRELAMPIENATATLREFQAPDPPPATAQ
jgi:hypothetical protein